MYLIMRDEQAKAIKSSYCRMSTPSLLRQPKAEETDMGHENEATSNPTASHRRTLITFTIAVYISVVALLSTIPKLFAREASSILSKSLVYQSSAFRFQNLFEFSPSCEDLWFSNESHIACNFFSNMSVPFVSATFLPNTPPVLYGSATYIVDITVVSPGSGCSDVWEALIAGTDSEGRLITFLAHVEALGKDHYRVRANINRPGTYKLKIRPVWKSFSPLPSCRAFRSCLKDQSWDAEKNKNVLELLLFITQPPSATDIPSFEKLEPSGEKGNNEDLGGKKNCQTMEDLMDGVWVWNSSRFDLHGYAYLHDILGDKNITDRITKTKMVVPTSLWLPNTCYLTAYNVSYLQALFRGKHIHIVGDSTLHEMLRLLLALFGVVAPDLPSVPPCKRRNRAFDSGSRYPVRLSFAWAGGPQNCDDCKGIGTLVNGSENAPFLKRFHNDADFVIANVGLHEMVSGMPVESYIRAIPKYFNILLGQEVAVKQGSQLGHSKHTIWLSTNPLTGGKCPGLNSDGDGGITWINWLASGIARKYGFTVMDSHRILKAAHLVSAAHQKKTCGDGVHCGMCDACWAKALILMQYMVSVLVSDKTKNI